MLEFFFQTVEMPLWLACIALALMGFAIYAVSDATESLKRANDLHARSKDHLDHAQRTLALVDRAMRGDQ